MILQEEGDTNDWILDMPPILFVFNSFFFVYKFDGVETIGPLGLHSDRTDRAEIRLQTAGAVRLIH